MVKQGINVFDESVRISDYKTIIIFGNSGDMSMVNGKIRDGECLFIPFQEGDYSGNSSKLSHENYASNTLPNYQLPELPQMSYQARLLTLGHTIIEEQSYTTKDNKLNKRVVIYVPKKPTAKQLGVLDKVKLCLEEEGYDDVNIYSNEIGNFFDAENVEGPKLIEAYKRYFEEKQKSSASIVK